VRDPLVIPARFNGTPEGGNGGYTCGRIAAYLDGSAEIDLRRPPPLERPLEVRGADEGIVVLDGEEVVAEARETELEAAPPEPVTLAEAEAASRRCPWLEHHVFPTCFVCGPERAPGDGLRIFPGPVAGSEVWAAHWTPASEFADRDGAVRDEFVWAALDCPSAGPVGAEADGGPMVLARFGVRRIGAVQTEEPCVIVSWPIGIEGRKRYGGSALFSASGEPRAVAEALWVKLKR
jgi:hypothetical protein